MLLKKKLKNLEYALNLGTKSGFGGQFLYNRKF